MTDYSVLSDEEVNMAVAFHIGLTTVKNAEEGIFTPCSDPSDSWPIIVDHKIDIQFRTSMPNPIPMAKNGDLYSIDINPLRAAMIVFLMMQENNHD